MHHANLAQTLLRDREKITFAFMNARGLFADALGVITDSPYDGRQDHERGQSERQIHSHHHHECGDQHHHRGKYGGETFVVDRLDALRIIGHAKAGVRAASRIVEFQR